MIYYEILMKVGSTWIFCWAYKMLNRFGFWFTVPAISRQVIFQLEFCCFQISFSAHLYIVRRQRWPSAKLICLQCGKKETSSVHVIITCVCMCVVVWICVGVKRAENSGNEFCFLYIIWKIFEAVTKFSHFEGSTN